MLITIYLYLVSFVTGFLAIVWKTNDILNVIVKILLLIVSTGAIILLYALGFGDIAIVKV